MSDDYQFRCSTHGGYREHSHHCPKCISEVVRLLRVLRDAPAPMCGAIAQKALEFLGYDRPNVHPIELLIDPGMSAWITNETRVVELVKLRMAADDAIEMIKFSRSSRPISGAINWSDLRCLQAAWVTTDGGESYPEITIEEATPDCPELQAAITQALETRWPDVRVVTEW